MWRSSGSDRAPAASVETRASDEQAVHSTRIQKASSVVPVDAAAVKNRYSTGDLYRAGNFAELPANQVVNGGGVSRRCGLSGADGPHGLIRNEDPAHRFLLNERKTRAQLAQHHLLGVFLLTLVDLLADAEHWLQCMLQGNGALLRRDVIRLAEDVAPLGVPHESYSSARFSRHRRRVLARERALCLRMNVLNTKLYVGARAE